MGIENEVAKTPREHFTRDADDELKPRVRSSAPPSAVSLEGRPSHEHNFLHRQKFGAIWRNAD